MREMEELLEVMERLRSPTGCPWDRAQTPQSLRAFVIEEAYEVAEAIDSGQWDALRDEVGDLLLQVVFLSRIAEEEERFDFASVARAIRDKLVRRHPHVFAREEAESIDAVWEKWEEIKREEARAKGGERRSRLDGLPKALPALSKALHITEKAARIGIDAASTDDAMKDLKKGCRVVAETLERDSAEMERNLGDLLFAAAVLARKVSLDPEACLAKANRRFIDRFVAVERRADAEGLALETLDERTLERLWESSGE